MVREARELVRSGAIGAVRKVVVEYHQGWLAGALESSEQQAVRHGARIRRAAARPARWPTSARMPRTWSPPSPACELESLCADLVVVRRRAAGSTTTPGLLLRFAGGARGVMSASQIAAGNENDLRLRVMGERGMLDWRQEEPNLLVHAPVDGPRRTLTRNSPGLSEAARRACRLPPGHPEGFIEAFANLYLGVAADLRLRAAQGRAATPRRGRLPAHRGRRARRALHRDDGRVGARRSGSGRRSPERLHRGRRQCADDRRRTRAPHRPAGRRPPLDRRARAGLRVRPAAGAHRAGDAGLAHDGRAGSGGDRLPHADRHSLHVQVPVGAADGPRRPAAARSASRLGRLHAVAAGGGAVRAGRRVAHDRAAAVRRAGRGGGVRQRVAGHRRRRLPGGPAAARANAASARRCS